MPIQGGPCRTLCPFLQDLERIKGIEDLTHAITRFIDPSRLQNGPDHVAYVYLAFCQALQSQGMASIKAMPSFEISYRDQYGEILARVYTLTLLNAHV
jgi:hypothetical protein